MSSRRLIAGGVGAAALLTTALAPGTAGADGFRHRVLVEGLSSPKGIDVVPNGTVIVSQGAFGPPAGPVIAYDPSAPRGARVTEVTEPFSLVDVAISPLDGTGWGLSTDTVLYHELADGSIVAVLNVPEYQEGDPDPVDQDNFPEESNPYGLTVMPNGDALVADAAGNDIIRVTPGGVATTFATFDVETIGTDHLPPAQFPGLPPTLTAEAVPTSVTVGPDGAVYVGELKGFPFRPGSSHVWRIEADADGALCSVNTPSDDCTVYAEGLTAVQDIAFGQRGWLYSLQLAEEGVLAFEEGFETGEFPDAQLLEIRRLGKPDEQRRDLGAGISQPGGVDISKDGRIYVTDHMFALGEDEAPTGRLLRIER